MRKRLLLIVGALIISWQLAAQDKTLSGKVSDANGAPIPNASVLVKGTTVGTATKSDGTYSITVPGSAKILVFSAVGVASLEVPIGASLTIDVTLRVDDKSLTEVVVVGYQQRRKRDEAGAISSVRGKEIENIPNPSLDKALQGKAAGVLVQSNNGIPGGAVNVRIRGIGSFNAGTQPLYVVDGVQMNTRSDAAFTQSNPLAFLNPNDIESIDVLKDAATAAIYGAQASNGVVIITTKKGKAGKTRFTFNAYWGQASPLQKLDVTNSQEYAQLRYEALQNANPQVSPLAVKQALLNEVRVPIGNITTEKAADSAIAALQTYDWQDAAFRNGAIQNYEMSAGGGNDRTTFRLSASYSFQEAVVTKADFQRGTVKFDMQNKANDKLTINSSINVTTFTQNLPFAVEGSFLGSPAFASTAILPTNPIYNPDGSYFGVPPQNVAGVLNQNIIAVADFNTGYQRTNQIVGNISADYKFAPWLTFRSFFGLDYRLVQGKLYRDPRTPDAFVRKGLGQVQSNWNTNVLTTQTFNFVKNINDRHRIDGLVGFEYRAENNESISASGDGFPTFQFTTLNTAANPLTVGEFLTGYKRMGVFGSVNYNYDGRYIISGILRYDGSSRFGEDNKFGTFPSIKVAWNLDNEQFMQRQSWISTLRLRASWGQTGNDQIGNFDALGLYGGGPVYGGSAGITFTQLANPNLKWERNETINFGVDFGFFAGNRLNGSIELYQKLTKDLLLTQPVQWTTGFGGISLNTGEMENRGVELTIGGTILKSSQAGGFNWNANFVFTYNKNKIKTLYGGLKELPGDPSTRVGREFQSVFVQQYAGVNPATGRPMWYDTLGNLSYQVQARDRVYIGDQQPNYWGGLTNTFSYRGFTLDIFFQYEYGRLGNDGQVAFLTENLARLNELQVIYDKRWTKPGQITAFPRQHSAGAESKGSGGQSGSRNWYKADYIRLKNVMLSYDISTRIVNKLKLANARFYIQATNMWTYADWYGYDVEFLGTGTGIIPQSKNITFGVQLGF
jgi:TonB-dependent starch-binding outer membrane protein SusC